MNPVTHMMALIDASLNNVTFLIFGSVSNWIIDNSGPFIKLALLGLIFSWFLNLTGSDFAKDLYQLTLRIALTMIVATSWPYYGELVVLITGAPNELGVSALNAMTGGDANSMDEALGEFLNNGLSAAGNAFSSFSLIMGIIVGIIILLATVVLTAGLLLIIIQSKVMLAVWMGFGGIFLIMFIFGFTSGLYKTWLMQVLNWALIPMIAYPVAAIFLPQAEKIIATPDIDEKLFQSVVLLILAFISWINLKQVPSSVAGVIGGLALGDEYRARRNVFDKTKKLFKRSKSNKSDNKVTKTS